MEWKKITIRKVSVTNQSKMEISDERRKHTRKVELIDTSIQETEICIGTMNNTSYQSRSEPLNRLEIDDQDTENMSGEDSRMIENSELSNANTDGQAEETGNNSRLSPSINASPKSEENLDLSLIDLDNPSNAVEKNVRLSEKMRQDGTNESGDNGSITGREDCFSKFPENLDLTEKELHNFIDYNEKCKEPYTNTDNNKNFKTKAMPLKIYEIDNTHATHDVNIKQKNHGVKGNFTETKMKVNSNNPNYDDETDKTFTNNPLNYESMLKYISKVKPLPKPNFSHILCSSKDILAKGNGESIKKVEDGMKGFRNRSVPLDNRSNIKKYKPCLSFSANEVKRTSLSKGFFSKSVTDLITYFESLNTPKQSGEKIRNLKTKRKLFESNQNAKHNHNIKMDENIKSKSSPSSSSLKKINPKACDKRTDASNDGIVLQNENTSDRKELAEGHPKDLLSNSNSDDKKLSVEIPPEGNLVDVIFNKEKKFVDVSTKDANSGGNKKSIEICSDDNVSDVNNCVKQTPVKIITEDIPPTVNIVVRNNAIEIPSEISTSYMSTSFKEKVIEIPSEVLTSHASTNITERYDNIPDSNLLYMKTHKRKQTQSPTTKLRICGYCEGKCVHFEQALNNSMVNAIRNKEDIIISNDELHRETGNSRVSNNRHFRSKFTRKHIKPIYQGSVGDLNNSKKHHKTNLMLNANNTTENGNILQSNVCERALSSSLTQSTLNRLSFMENSSTELNHEQNHLSERKISKSHKKSPYMKSFIGILITVMIFVVICKGVSENYKLW